MIARWGEWRFASASMRRTASERTSAGRTGVTCSRRTASHRSPPQKSRAGARCGRKPLTGMLCTAAKRSRRACGSVPAPGRVDGAVKTQRRDRDVLFNFYCFPHTARHIERQGRKRVHQPLGTKQAGRRVRISPDPNRHAAGKHDHSAGPTLHPFPIAALYLCIRADESLRNKMVEQGLARPHETCPHSHPRDRTRQSRLLSAHQWF